MGRKSRSKKKRASTVTSSSAVTPSQSSAVASNSVVRQSTITSSSAVTPLHSAVTPTSVVRRNLGAQKSGNQVNDTFGQTEETVEEMSAGDHDVEIFEERDKVGEARDNFCDALKGISLNKTNDSSSESSFSEHEASEFLSQMSERNSKRFQSGDGSHCSKFLIPGNMNTTNEDTENESDDAVSLPRPSYVMKLFDRNVDLSQFDDTTPLYSVCRSWVKNQPKKPWEKKDPVPVPVLVKDEPVDETEKDKKGKDTKGKGKDTKGKGKDTKGKGKQDDGDKLTADRINIVRLERLPPPTYTVVGPALRIPALLPRRHDEVHQILPPENADPATLPTKEELMRDHLRHWKAVRKTWREASKKNEERFAMSKELLDAIFIKARKK